MSNTAWRHEFLSNTGDPSVHGGERGNRRAKIGQLKNFPISRVDLLEVDLTESLLIHPLTPFSYHHEYG